MLQAKPSSALNPETAALYGGNVLRIVRQVFYSHSNKNSIDLVLFVNGLPVATVELKTESTQSVHAAIKQYRKDRLPKDAATHKPEPLLQFKSRCVVHLESKLDAAGIYLESEVDAFASFYWDPKRKKDSHFQLQKYLGPPCDRFKQRYVSALNEDDGEAKDTLEIFAKDIGSFTKLFEFISQIYDFAGDEALEKRYSFFKELSPILWNIIREGRDSQVIDLSDVRLSHYAIHPSGRSIGSLEPDTTAQFEPAYGDVGSAASHDPERVKLQQLIEQLNLIFEGELSDNDLVNYAYGVRDKLMENDKLRTQALNNTKKQFDESDELLEAILSAVEVQDAINSSLASQVMSDPRVRASFIQVIRDLAYEGFRKEAV